MEIVELKHQASLLDASDAETCDDGDYCDELGFNVDKSMNPKA